MARRRKVEVAAINIRVHPHTAGTYRGLLRDAFGQKLPVRVRGDQHLLLSYVDERSNPEVVYGTIARFTKIEVDARWFDIERLDEIDVQELQQLRLAIPPTLHPNYNAFNFAFSLNDHVFIFERYGEGQSLSIRALLKLFLVLFEQPAIKNNYGEVLFDPVQDSDKLDFILNIPRLKRLEITVRLPNADALGDAENEFQERLLQQHARSYAVELQARSGDSLAPDNDTRLLAELALRNGHVQASGSDDEGFVQRSSVDHPRIQSLRYDPDHMSLDQAFRHAAAGLLNKVRSMVGSGS